jgi:hypothetical protein
VRRDPLRGCWGAGNIGSRRRSRCVPEIAYIKSLDAAAFNGNATAGVAQNRKYEIIGAAHMIIRF